MGNPAETYESYMVPALFAPWGAHLVEAAGPAPGHRVLDLGCGTGIVARLAAARVGSTGAVVGVDVSPDMLEVARAAAAREALPIEWREGRAEALPFPDGEFDLVLSQFALMFFADRPSSLSEMRRVLRAGGGLALSVFQGLDRHPFYVALHEAIGRRLGASSVDAIFALGDEGQLRRLFIDAGFERVTIEPALKTARFPEPDQFLAGEIDVDTAAIPSMQRLDEAARAAMVAAIGEDMEAPLRRVTRDGHVVLPFHAHIVRAYRG